MTTKTASVVWERELTQHRPGFRIVSDGNTLSFEQAKSRDALGAQRWSTATFADVPGEGVRFMAATVCKSNTAQENFTYDADELTPQIVCQLIGQPLSFAAEAMATALDDKQQEQQALAAQLGKLDRVNENENVFTAAMRAIAEMAASKAAVDAELSATKSKLHAALDGANDLIETMLSIQHGIIDGGCSPPPIGIKSSLCKQAAELLTFLARSLIITDVKSITTTVVTQRPALPSV